MKTTKRKSALISAAIFQVYAIGGGALRLLIFAVYLCLIFAVLYAFALLSEWIHAPALLAIVLTFGAPSVVGLWLGPILEEKDIEYFGKWREIIRSY